MEVLRGPAAMADAEQLGGGAGAYWRRVLAQGAGSVAENLGGSSGLLRQGEVVIPFTALSPESDASFASSLRTQYLLYPQEELHFLSSERERQVARVALQAAAALAKLVSVDRVVQWSDFLLSTNHHRPDLAEHVKGATAALSAAYPKHALLVRSLDRRSHGAAIAALEAEGYLLLPSRVVYYFDGVAGGFASRNTTKRDRRMLSDGRFEAVGGAGFSAADGAALARLYRQVYVDKHSRLNTRYLAPFLSRAVEEGMLSFRGLRDGSGALVAAIGIFSFGGLQTVPFVGYEVGAPAEDALYRRLVSGLLEEVKREKLLLNYSSGADDFKRRRGGEPVAEYHAVYAGHLSASRRLLYRGLAEAVARGSASVFSGLLAGEIG